MCECKHGYPCDMHDDEEGGQMATPAPESPIAGMSLTEAKRSFLMQLEGLERYRQEVFGKDPATLSDEEVSRLYAEGQVRYNNLEMTEDHIDRLEETSIT